MYNKSWSQFETQSLAFAILRKNLYPDLLVRGEHGYIKIYTPTADRNAPKLKLDIKVSASDSPAESGFSYLGGNQYHLIGGDKAYKVLEFIKPLL